MAKISARGAIEAAKFEASKAGASTVIVVLCSDGRVLDRLKYESGGSSQYRRAGRGADFFERKADQYRAAGYQVTVTRRPVG